MSTQKAASVPIKSTGCAPSADKTALTSPCLWNSACHSSTMLATGIAMGIR